MKRETYLLVKQILIESEKYVKHFFFSFHFVMNAQVREYTGNTCDQLNQYFISVHYSCSKSNKREKKAQFFSLLLLRLLLVLLILLGSHSCAINTAHSTMNMQCPFQWPVVWLGNLPLLIRVLWNFINNALIKSIHIGAVYVT